MQEGGPDSYARSERPPAEWQSASEDPTHLKRSRSLA